MTVAEAAMTIDRERRVIGHLVVEIQAAEPPISEVKLDFLAQLALEADAVAVADDQHPQHELGIDGRPADLAVEGPQLLAKVGQHPRHDRVDAAQEMARRNALFQVEQVEQLALIARLPPHHRPSPRRQSELTESQFTDDHESFFNTIDPIPEVWPDRLFDIAPIHSRGLRSPGALASHGRRTRPTPPRCHPGRGRGWL